MHHRRKHPTHIHWNILTWECDVHGPHRVIIAGLDDTADLVADLTEDTPIDDAFKPTITRKLISLADAWRAADREVDLDDLPY